MKEFSKKYLSILTNELAGINLTRINDDEEEFYYKQIFDSIEPLEKSKVFQECLAKTKTMVDIGFGGGFPILPLAHTNKDCKFLGMEARGKKAKAVDKIREHLAIENAQLLHRRFETVNFDQDCVVTFKAVGRIEDLLPQFTTKKNLYVFFYKGPNFHELEDVKVVEKDWELIEEISIDVPYTEGRLLIGFKNKNVLRGTSLGPKGKKVNKDLVNLTDLL